MTLPKGWKPTEEKTPISLNEEIIWRDDVMKGIINRKVAETRLITNLRVAQNDRVINLSELDDIIVMNQHRSSEVQDYTLELEQEQLMEWDNLKEEPSVTLYLSIKENL